MLGTEQGGQHCALRMLRRTVCSQTVGPDLGADSSFPILPCEREDDRCLLDLPAWSEANGLGSRKGEPTDVFDIWKEL